MRGKLFIHLGLLFLGGMVSAATINVYLQGGQSNADGRAVTANFGAPYSTAQSNYMLIRRTEVIDTPTVQQLQPGLSESSQSGPELSFASQMADKYGSTMAYPGGANDSVVIIKYANGGTNLHTHWKADGTTSTATDGTDYVRFQETVNWGLTHLATTYPDATINVAGMYWMQGESDAGQTTAEYEANLTTFINDIRATYGANLPFVIGKLSSGQTSINATELADIQTAQQNVADTMASVTAIDTDSFGLKADNLHFNAAGQTSMGIAFADALNTIGAVSFVNHYSADSAKDYTDVYAHYSFDEDLNDSANSNDATGTPAGYSTADKKFGSGAVNLSVNALTVPAKTYSSGTAYTVAFWMKRNNKDEAWNLAIGDSSTNNHFIGLKNDEILRWRGAGTSSDRQVDFATAVADDTAWHHFAIVASDADGGGTVDDITLYVDGTLVGTSSVAIQTGFSINNIGKPYTSSLGVKGLLDELWIISKAASATEINNLYQYNSLTTDAKITNLNVNDASNSADWSIQNNLQVGDESYGDRTGLGFTSLPAEVVGCDWVRTANDSKNVNTNPLATFDVVTDSRVYVAWNTTTEPDTQAWLSSEWTNTGLTATSSAVTYTLYSKEYAAGSTVQLGPNLKNNGMYVVIVKDGITLTPALGLTMTFENSVLSWTVDSEHGVKEYQVIDSKSGEVITTVNAGESNYQITLTEEITNPVLIVVDNSGYQQKFTVDNETSLIIELNTGWNMISVPFETDPAKLGETVWVWSNDFSSYYKTDRLSSLQGAWVFSSAAKDVLLQGEATYAEWDLLTGWNLVGPSENLITPEDTTVYGWDNGYQNTGVLSVGKGYWIYVE